jgi:DNA invertase Pin-like site-specific DNA recombinase
VKVWPKPKLTPQQIDHARKLIDDEQRREDVAAILNANGTTPYRALSFLDGTLLVKRDCYITTRWAL